MGNRLKGTYWDQSPHQTRTSSSEARQRLGIRDSTRKQRSLATEQDEKGQQQLAHHNLTQYTARQAFQVLRGQHPPTPDIALPMACTQQPPAEPNVYPDGSLTSPTEPLYSLGGAGAWHPRRQLHEQGTSEAEANMAVVSQEAEGLKLFTHMNGYGGSSTRLEITGALLGMVADKAVHLGTDSSSFLKKALTIHNHIRSGTLPKRPWPLQKDGDMWHMYYRHAAAKTVDAIAITKVKGHATQSMVDTGRVKAADKAGNDKADEAADEGVELFGQPIVKLSKLYARRHTAYSGFIGDLQEHIAFIYKVRATMLQATTSTGTPASGTTSKPHIPMTTITHIPYLDRPEVPPHRFKQAIQVQQCPRLCQRHPAIVHIQAFLRDIPYHITRRSRDGDRGNDSLIVGTAGVDVPTGDDRQGITWLELYGLYRMAGYPEPLSYDRALANRRPTLRQQLHKFTQAMRQLVGNTMLPEHHYLMKGTRDKHGKRLASLGIATNLAILPWQPHFTLEAQHRLAQELLRSQYRLTIVQAERALRDRQQLATRPMQLKGRVKWSASIKAYTKQLYHTSQEASQQGASTSHEQPTTAIVDTNNGQLDVDTGWGDGSLTAGAAAAGGPNQPAHSIIYFQCPRCPHKLPGTREAFHLHNLDSRLWCNSCRKSLFVRKWRCSCNLPWHNCPRHHGDPARLRAMQQAPASHRPTTQQCPDHTAHPRQQPKRTLGQGRDESIQRWLDMPPVKRARVLPEVIELEDTMPSSEQMANTRKAKAHLLGPKLLAKFPRLAMEREEKAQHQPSDNAHSEPLTKRARAHCEPPKPHSTTAEHTNVSAATHSACTAAAAADLPPQYCNTSSSNSSNSSK